MRLIATSSLRAALKAAPSFLLFALLLGTSVAPLAQTTLTPGDLAVIGYSSDDNDAVAEEDDEFALLALIDIEVGTEIFITDKGVAADGSLQADGESIRGFTTQQAISAGEVFIFSRTRSGTQLFPAAFGTPTSGGSSFGFGLSTSGDQITVFQENGDDTNTYIYALSATPFDEDFDAATGSNTDTALPPGLTNGTTAVDFEDDENVVDNVYYDRMAGTSGTRAAILALASNDDNYVQENSGEGFTLPGLLGSASFTITVDGGGDTEPALLITGVADGPLSGGLPKAVELYATEDIADLSLYGFGSANNGGGTDGVEFVLSGSASEGDFLYIASETDGFSSFFGFAPTFDAGAAAGVNGDDAVELFFDPNGLAAGEAPATASVIDVFGDRDVDGSGEAWEYQDGWAYRMDGTGPDGSTFAVTNWAYSGVNGLRGGDTNAAADVPFPIGTYSTMGSTEPTARLQVIHNSPDAAADTVDVYVNGDLFLDDLAFREATGFVNVPAGVDLEVAVTENNAMDASGAVFTQTYNLGEDSAVQLVATGLLGTDGDFTLLVGANALEESDDGFNVALRAVHGAPDAPPVDVRAGEMILFDDLAYPSITDGYVPVPPASYDLAVTTADGSMTVSTFTADLSTADGQAATVLASGFLTPAEGAPALGLLVVFGNGNTLFLSGPQTIAEARASGVGATVTVEGTVTRAMGAFTYFQDETGGLTIRQTGGDFREAVAIGDIGGGTVLRVTGTLSEFNDLLQINNTDLASYEILGTEDVPGPQTVTIAELADNGEDYEAELVLVQNVSFDATGTFEAGTNYDISDPTGASEAVALRVVGADDTMVDGTEIPTQPVTVAGVLGQFRTTYQILPINVNDIGADAISTEGLPEGALAIAVANPASGDAIVRYSVVDAAEVTLTAYDALGREVAVLASGPAAAGEYAVTWNASGVAPGVYVLRLAADDASVTRTVTVIR